MVLIRPIILYGLVGFALGWLGIGSELGVPLFYIANCCKYCGFDCRV
jgi:hypothetical protein